MTNDTPSSPGGRDAERADRLSREDRFEDSLAQTWDPGDAAVDRRLRSLIGPITPLYAPPYGFERVVLRARRRRNRGVMVGLAAGFTAIAVAAGAVVAGTRMNTVMVQTAGCGGSNSATAVAGQAAPGAADAAGAQQNTTVSGYSLGTGFGDVPAMAAAQAAVRTRDGAHGADGVGSGIGSGREVMDRKYEWAIGGVLTAAALAAGIVAGCSASNNGNEPSANATESGAPTPTPSEASPSQVQLPSATTATSPAASPTSLPLCVSTDLSPSVSIVPGSQATGHELMNVELTNTSGHTCTVFGFPGLQLEDRNNAGQATKVNRDFGVKPATIIVNNNASVATTVRFDFDMPVGDEPQTGPCEAQSMYLGIIPPDEKRQLSATIGGGPVTVCNHGTLDVLPFVLGTKGANQ